MEKYFAVEQETWRGFPIHLRVSLVGITDNKELKYISGDRNIADMLEIKKGGLAVSKRALLEYKIHLLGKTEAKFLKSIIEKSQFLSLNKKPHSYRKL